MAVEVCWDNMFTNLIDTGTKSLSVMNVIDINQLVTACVEMVAKSTGPQRHSSTILRDLLQLNNWCLLKLLRAVHKDSSTAARRPRHVSRSTPCCTGRGSKSPGCLNLASTSFNRHTAWGGIETTNNAECANDHCYAMQQSWTNFAALDPQRLWVHNLSSPKILWTS